MSGTPVRYHRWIIDAIEGDIARCEIGDAVVHLPRWLLPADARAGDVLRVRHEREGQRSRVTIVRDAAGTRDAMQASRDQLARTDASPGKGGRGDIAL